MAASSIKPMLKVKAALFGLAVVLVDLALDGLLPLLFGHSRLVGVFANLLLGASAACAMFMYMQYRLRLSEQRAAQIADLNHHIRNAMHAIALSHYTGDDAQRLKIMQDASDRINLALKEFSNHDKRFVDRPPDRPCENVAKRGL